jgi:hypothetical protein
MVIKLSAAGITKRIIDIFKRNYRNSEILENKFFSKTHSQYPYLKFNAARSGIEQSKLGTLKARWNCYLPIFYLTKDSIADNKSHVK